jgi:hypothetical protein
VLALVLLSVAAVQVVRARRAGLTSAFGPGAAPWAPGRVVRQPAWRLAGGRFEAVDRATARDRAAMRSFAAGRKGYVVWESRRPSGTDELKYRIWKRNLDGSGLAMISGEPFRDGYAHLGPRISPDGRFVVFAGRRWNSRSTCPGAQALYGGAYVAPPFDAWLVEIDPETLEAGAPRELTCLHNRLGTGGQDRFFEWKDARTVYVNLPAQRGIFEVDVIEDRIGCKLVTGVRGERLLSAAGHHAFCAAAGGVAVFELDHARPIARLAHARRLEGCQALPAYPDDFLLWMQAGGRVGVLDLTGNRTPGDGTVPGKDLQLYDVIADGHSPYHYCYFPALSRDRAVLACGASRYPPGVGTSKLWLRHSHNGADYEIFLCRFDPGTLGVLGDAVRYSFNSHRMYPEVLADPDRDDALRRGHALDRWPDVWVESPASEDSTTPGTAAAPGRRSEFEQLLGRARRLETVRPRAALDLYRRLAKLYHGRPGAEQAADRARRLETDPGFRRELAAWTLLEDMRWAASRINTSCGGLHSFRKNRWLAEANRHILRTLKADHARLLRQYPTTRAALEASGLVRRWDLPVPKITPASRRVVATVEAVADQVSRPLTPKEAHPYTQAFMTAAFDVRRVVSGELSEKRIVVVLMSMDDDRNLPPAAYEAGKIYRLRLGLWADQTHFHSHKIADEILALDAAYYYAFNSAPVR